jgi:hypothetical protein
MEQARDRLSLPEEMGHCCSKASEGLYSCQEVTLFLRIQRTEEGVLKTIGLKQTELTVPFIQTGYGGNPSASKLKRLKRRNLHDMFAFQVLVKLKLLKTSW